MTAARSRSRRCASAGDGARPAELEQRRAAISPQDGCLFIYTSGTTGPPKACELTHGNYRAVTSAVQARGVVREDDLVYLFLPLAHALALVIQFVVLDLGATLAYWEKDPQKIVANLMELRPTFFPSVPRIFEKIHTLATTTGDREQLEQATRVGSAVRRARERGEPVSEQLQAAFERAEQAVYVNVRNLFGGRLRQAVTGAAPIAPEILEFFYACGVPVMEGYGLTETASVATVNTLDAFRLGSVGPPLPGVEVRIADDGEILIKGPNIFNGYYRDAAGDPRGAGRRLAAHRRSRTTRRRRLPLHHRPREGHHHHRRRQEHRARQPREPPPAKPLDRARGRDRRRPPVPGGLDHARRRADTGVRARARPRARAAAPLRRDARRDPDVIDEVNSHYARVEQIKRFEILPDELSQPTGELTPTLKIKRNVVQDKYADTIDAIYRRPDDSTSADTTSA